MTSTFIRVIVVLCSATVRLAAQQATTVSGTVINSGSGAGIAGATVTIDGSGSNLTTKTGTDGKFSLTGVPSGKYRLQVRADGFYELRVDGDTTSSGAPIEIKLNADLHLNEVVSVSPDVRSTLDSYQPTTVLGGQDLAIQLQATLGATLANQPGVAERSFGPGPARPVIRGLDGDRVLVLQDGQRMGDLSSQSGDHGVNVNPASASRLEVVRGPATLLYGANAIGGLVNVITKSIPTAPVQGATGSMTLDAGSAASEGGAAGDATIGNGNLALHFSGSARRSGEYRSPEGTIPNSFNRAGFGELGLAYTAVNGYLGGSFGYDRTHYGIPLVEEGETNLNPRRKIFDLRGERRGMTGFITAVRASVGVRRYRHDELDGDVVGTSFTNNTSELEVLASHRASTHLKGSFGFSALTRTFSAAGEEVLSPEVGQKGTSGYLYEEAPLSRMVTLQFGGRIEHASFDPKGGLTPRQFTNVSGSFGLLVRPSHATTIALSVARAARNPALEELYFHGPHGGNNAFENGDETLQSEQALGVDASFRWQASRASGEVTFFVNRIQNFIFRRLSGEIVEELPESFFTQGDATLHGVESHLDLRVTNTLWIEGGLDSVHGQLTSLDQPLPRMPPLRGRLGAHFQRNTLQIGVDGTMTATQDRIFVVDGVDGPVGETPTDGYTLMKVYAAYSFARGKSINTIGLRVDNADDALYHNHLNYLKDLAPEVGRDFRVTYTIKY